MVVAIKSTAVIRFRNMRTTNTATFLLILSLWTPTFAIEQKESGQETVWDQIMAAQAVRQMRSGAESMQEKDYDRATREFAKAVIAQPNDPTAHMMLGAAYYWTGKVDLAESEFRETLRLDPKNAQGHLLMGIVRAWKGDAKASYPEFVDAVNYAPDRPDAAMDLGSIEEALGMNESALDHLRKAVQLQPQDAIYHYQLGMMYRHLGRDEDAEASMRSALKINPDFEDALLEMAAALERQGKTQEAQSMFYKAVRLKSRDAVARLRLGRVYLVNGRPDLMRDVFRDAFHLTPDTGSGLALSAAFGGKPQDSKTTSPTSNPQDSVEPKDPMEMLARNLQRIPLDQDAKLTVEMVFLQRPKLEPKKPEEGGSELKRALAQAGKPQATAATPMGVRREFILPASSGPQREAQIQKLIAELRETAKQAPQNSDVRLAMNLNYLPKSSGRKSPSGATTTAQGTPKASYNPHDVGNDMGLWVMGTGWVPLVQEVLPLSGEQPSHPDSADWWVTDGLGYATIGNGALALTAFNRALALDPKDELALLGRAVAYVEVGDEAQAIDTYRQVLEINPKSRSAQEGLKWLLKAPAK
jgi:Flp pilus assembly protein TadD